MRTSCLVALLVLASSATAQPDPFRALSLGAGPASGFSGFAGYTEVRADLAISPALSVRPVLGLTGESGRDVPVPCLVPPCPETRVERGVWVAPGLGFALGVPEARLPGPIADAHVGVFGQSAFQKGREMELRAGIEVGAAVRLSTALTLGADVQASRHVRQAFDGDGFFVERTSIVPMARLSYSPVSAPPHPGEVGGFTMGLASGLSTGFENGAAQTELRVSVPLDRWGLAFEPVVGWTEAFGYLVPDPAVDCSLEGGCPLVKVSGADAVSIGARLAAHSGETRAFGIGFADSHFALGAHLESPTRESSAYRFSLSAGADVQVTRGLALGAEVQASTYTYSEHDRAPLTLAPLLRLTVGG